MIPIQAYPSLMPSIKKLKQRRKAITDLCKSLEHYLAFDIDEQLESFTRLQNEPRRISVTPEMLVAAQAQLETMETQVSTVTRMLESVPEELAAMIEVVSLPQIQQSLEHQRSIVKNYQDQLDGKTYALMCECGASLMADGSEVFAGTREECDMKARECGWTVNNNEHTCPECSAQ